MLPSRDGRAVWYAVGLVVLYMVLLSIPSKQGTPHVINYQPAFRQGELVQSFLSDHSIPSQSSNSVSHNSGAVASKKQRQSASPSISSSKDQASKLTVLDLCTTPKPTRQSCSLTFGEQAYVFFLNNSSGLAVPRRGRDPDDTHNYFQYIYAATSRLHSLTSQIIVILVTREVPQAHRDALKSIGPRMDIREIIPMYEAKGEGMKTDRAYHLHSFGKLEVLNPKWLGDFKTVISMDTDTFSIRAPDEVFCMPGIFAAAKRKNNMRSGFNSGLFMTRPSVKSYNGVIKLMLDAAESTSANGENPNSFGEQPLLNRYFDSSNEHCFGAEYNCGGFGPPAIGAGSLKCDLTGPSEQPIFDSRSVLHIKLTQSKQAERLPQTAALWRSYLPADPLYNI